MQTYSVSPIINRSENVPLRRVPIDAANIFDALFEQMIERECGWGVFGQLEAALWIVDAGSDDMAVDDGLVVVVQ